MRSAGKFSAAALILMCVIIFPCANVLSNDRIESKEIFVPVFQKGICYVSWENLYSGKRSLKSLAYMAEMGVEWVSISPLWFQDNFESVEVKRGEKTVSDEEVVKFIKIAHALGLKVFLKPHVDLIETEDTSRVDISFSSALEWEKWFESYREMIINYAKMAEENNVELFCVGVELTGTSMDMGDLWRGKIIRSVRNTYSGKLTYAANWYEEYTNIDFWDALDYAGLDAYFPLTEKEDPSYEELLDGWKPILDEIEGWAENIARPVIFTEMGYHSADGAARVPFQWHFKTKVNLKLQDDCYKALIETFKDKKWFYGVYWWYWHVSLNKGGKNDRSFVIRKKPAEETLKNWYSHDILRKRWEVDIKNVNPDEDFLKSISRLESKVRKNAGEDSAREFHYEVAEVIVGYFNKVFESNDWYLYSHYSMAYYERAVLHLEECIGESFNDELSLRALYFLTRVRDYMNMAEEENAVFESLLAVCRAYIDNGRNNKIINELVLKYKDDYKIAFSEKLGSIKKQM